MKKWTEKLLEEDGYKIINMAVRNANISMKECGAAELLMTIEGSGYGCIYGGYVIGHGYLGSKDFSGSDMGMESILRIMDVVGAETFNDIKGKYIRAAFKGLGSSVKIIGNILEDKWFDIESFFEDKRKELESEQSNAAKGDQIEDWIPCSVRLPDYTEKYIVTVEEENEGYRYTDIKVFESYLDNKGSWKNLNKNLKVVAWMEKPESWKGETK